MLVYKTYVTLAIPILSLFLLSGCGIRPLRSVEQEVTCQVKLDKLSYVELNNNQIAYLKRFFISEWERGQHCSQHSQKYTLDLDFKVQTRPAFIQGDTTVARTDMMMTIHYTLRHNNGNTVIDKQKLILVDSYDNTESHYSNFIAERGISNNLIRNAARELRLALITNIIGKAKPAPDDNDFHNTITKEIEEWGDNRETDTSN